MNNAIDRALEQAAARIMRELNRVLRENPGSVLHCEFEDERVTVTFVTPVARVLYRGGDLQDALAHAVTSLTGESDTVIQ